MKNTTIHLLILALLPLANLPAASFNKAEITRLEKDVKILKENAAPHSATMGEQINPVTSVATGVASRVELRFPDKSLTRLGANSRFTLHGEGRTLDLDKGVMLLEVPQKIIGAKVRTAAVTAAVTGGTIMIEYLPNGFIKIFCLDGHLDVVNNANPSDFLTLNAGQFLLMPANAKEIPRPAAEFDINLMLKTSKLVSPDEVGTPTDKDIADAVKDQAKEIFKGDLIKTNLIIPGRGTLVSLSNNTALNLFNNFTLKDDSPPAPKTGGGPNPPKAPPTFTGFIPLITDTTILNGNGRIKTDPQVTAYNTGAGKIITSEGLVYNGNKDKPFPFFAFGSLNISDPDLQPLLNSKGDWAAYKFDTLIINGTPEFAYDNNIRILRIIDTIPSTPQIGNVILAAQNNIILDANNALANSIGFPAVSTSNSLDLSGNSIVTSLLLYSQDGSVELASNFSIYSADRDVSIIAASSSSDVTLRGDVTIENAKLLIGAGHDVLINSYVTADDVAVHAGRDATVDGSVLGDAPGGIIATNGNLFIAAKRHIHITNSAQLTALASLDNDDQLDALLRLESIEGDITVDKKSKIKGTNVEIEAFKGNVSILNSNVSATHALKVGAFKPDGTLLISGSTLTGGPTTPNASDLIRLYAGGSNGKVLFQGKVTLDSDEVQIAGKVVQVDAGGVVSVPKGNTHVFSDSHNYNTTGYGNINSTYLQQYNFNHASKPDFKTGGKLGRPISP